jgi:hypothetical protein
LKKHAGAKNKMLVGLLNSHEIPAPTLPQKISDWTRCPCSKFHKAE